jgi:hypothetical protein
MSLDVAVLGAKGFNRSMLLGTVMVAVFRKQADIPIEVFRTAYDQPCRKKVPWPEGSSLVVRVMEVGVLNTSVLNEASLGQASSNELRVQFGFPGAVSEFPGAAWDRRCFFF